MLQGPGARPARVDTLQTGNSTEHRYDARASEFRAADVILDAKRAPIACTVIDISESGVRLHIETPHRIPDTFGLAFNHPRQTRNCRLVWREGNELGARFVDND